MAAKEAHLLAIHSGDLKKVIEGDSRFRGCYTSRVTTIEVEFELLAPNKPDPILPLSNAIAVEVTVLSRRPQGNDSGELPLGAKVLMIIGETIDDITQGKCPEWINVMFIIR